MDWTARVRGMAAMLVLLLFALAGLFFARQNAAVPAPVQDSPEPAQPTSADYAQALLDAMTTREKICQLLIVSPEALLGGGDPVTERSDALARALNRYPVGGLILSAGNFETRTQTVHLTRALQRGVEPPPLLCVDEEGGRVGRLMYTVGTTKLNSMFSYRDEGTDTAYANAVTLARDLRACGFNTDFAPVADVWSNADNTVIGNRAYSDDYDEAAELVAAAVRGFRDNGVVCCLKHFPGHGSTETDSHEDRAVVDKTLRALLQEDLKPFASGIAAGADMVMVGHLTVPSLDTAPASMSYRIVTGLLRQRLGFRGVVITDGLEMEAAGDLTDGEKAVRCLQAGADMLLELEDVPGAVAAVEQALADGTLSQVRLDESVLRVLTLKLEHNIIPVPVTVP